MGSNATLNYWDYRAKLSYSYMNEIFYTVTPIPYYYKRRKTLLEIIEPLFKDNKVIDICDVGCGDGWYIKYLSSKYTVKNWYGIDASAEMTELAQRNCPNAYIQHSENGITLDHKFDIVFSIAVFAHITDDFLCEKLFRNIYSKLKSGGAFILFEQTGKLRRNGDNWCRRTTLEYVTWVSRSGFNLESKLLIAYPIHGIFEKYIAPYFCRFLVHGETALEKYINANKSSIYRLLSSLFIMLSGNPIHNDNGSLDGNTLYIFRKP